MTIDLQQMLYYVAFTFLGMWLTKRGLLNLFLPGNQSPPPLLNDPLAGNAPTSPSPLLLDLPTLITLLKAVLNQPTPALPTDSNALPTRASTIIHVPVEVTANSKVSTGGNSS